jgi:hypothetical protein
MQWSKHFVDVHNAHLNATMLAYGLATKIVNPIKHNS